MAWWGATKMCVLIYLCVFSRGLICGATPLSKVSKPVLSPHGREYLARRAKGNADAAKRLSSALAGSLISRRTGAAGIETADRAWAIYSSIFGPITVFESLGFGTAYALTTIMIATFALFVILSATNGWVVTHPHAWIYLAIYAAFVVYVILDAIPGIVPGPASR